MYLVFLLVALLAALVMPAEAGKSEKTQYVLISFDGAHSLDQWERSRALSRQTGAQFTYFLSCTFLLSWETRSAYRGPGEPAGKSNVGFGKSRDEVAARLRQIWAARREGHEIASHGCGHFNGGDWSEAQWQDEFAAFTRILSQTWMLNRIPFEPAGWQRFALHEIHGFRAPYLATNAAMYKALRASSFAYDASAVSRGAVAPHVEDRVYRFALPLIPEGPKQRRIIAMDYNLFVRHSAGLERPSDAKAFSDRAYEAFLAAFEREYEGGRRPLQLGFHFTLMNGGAYWDALERFTAEVCGKRQVRCLTHRDYLRETREEALGG